jgi:CRP/FNR family cyclic AMP-dependent transcriptional regulator
MVSGIWVILVRAPRPSTYVSDDMSLPLSVSELRQIPCFAPAPDSALQEVLDHQRMVSIATGQTLVMETDWGESVMVLLEGLAKVRSFNSDGEEIVYSLLGCGDLLGEIAVLDGDSRSADVISLSSAKLLKLQGSSFLRLLRTSPDLSLSLARLQARRLRDINNRFAIQRSDATSRILFTLAYIAIKSSVNQDPLAIIPPLSLGEVAIIAGMARETASRVMSKLRNKGLVVEAQGCLRLASMAPLQARGIWPA